MDALSDFKVEVIRAREGDYEVMVTLDEREIVAVLNALERHVTDRARSARITLDGRDYMMHPDPDPTT